MSISAESFRRVLAHLAGGVAVVTSPDTQGRASGMTATAVCSVSLSPPLVLACLDVGTNTHRAVSRSGLFAINILTRDHAALARRFAGDRASKFDGVAITPGITGSPLLTEALATCECQVVQTVPAGDHTIFVGRVQAASSSEEGAKTPLVYYRGVYGSLSGHDEAD